MLKSILCPIHREGWIYIAIFAVVTLVLFKIGHNPGWVGIILTAWCIYFFRDPARMTPMRGGLIISPADGLVQSITMTTAPEELGRGNQLLTRVSIFMNVFDVHVNRAPCDATVKDVKYIPGKFFNASLDKASKHNERQIFTLALDDGRELIVVQIAGLVARRILRWVKPGDRLTAGARFGMIRFGSRVDVYFPDGVQPLVIEGQKVLAGESVLADLKSGEPARIGKMH